MLSLIWPFLTSKNLISWPHKCVVCALVYGSGKVHGSFHCSLISMQAEVLGESGDWIQRLQAPALPLISPPHLAWPLCCCSAEAQLGHKGTHTYTSLRLPASPIKSLLSVFWSVRLSVGVCVCPSLCLCPIFHLLFPVLYISVRLSVFESCMDKPRTYQRAKTVQNISAMVWFSFTILCSLSTRQRQFKSMIHFILLAKGEHCRLHITRSVVWFGLGCSYSYL